MIKFKCIKNGEYVLVNEEEYTELANAVDSARNHREYMEMLRDSVKLQNSENNTLTAS
ncbi:MAG: hypothetical protein FWG64_10190 [Firmicutes bacterium]|nr:hypothetical protein [Bacillota bacterium]